MRFPVEVGQADRCEPAMVFISEGIGNFFAQLITLKNLCRNALLKIFIVFQVRKAADYTANDLIYNVTRV